METRLIEQENLISGATGVQTFCFDKLDSTNAYAKKVICEKSISAREFLVIAKKQNSGRGRLDRSFESEEGGIYMSYCFGLESKKLQNETSADLQMQTLAGTSPQPTKSQPAAALITSYPIVSSLAVLRTIEETVAFELQNTNAITDANVSTGANAVVLTVQIKWPNDIQINGKKVCGILTEALFVSGTQWIIVGIGVNVKNKISPQLIGAGSICQILAEIKSITRTDVGQDAAETESKKETEKEDITSNFNPAEEINIDTLIIKITSNLKSLFAQMPARTRELVGEVTKNCLSIGRRVRSESTGAEGVAHSIDIDGALIIETEGGARQKIIYGDVTVME